MSAKLETGRVRELLAHFAARAAVAADYFGDDLPDYYDTATAQWQLNGFWTEGFWPGLLWSLHASSGDERLAAHARRTTRLVAERKAGMDDHDLGFLFYPSCVLGHRLTGESGLLPPALAAADRLAARYRETGRYIPAHGPRDGPKAGFAIIDTLMNLPLLLWAESQRGGKRLGEIARETALTIAREHVRENGSSCQVLWLDPDTGRTVKREAVMAVSVDSCWARGQAWGIHGFAGMHALTGDSRFKDYADRMARYFLSRIPADGVVFHDLDDPAAPNVPKDTSAQAIAAGGILTLAEGAAGEKRGQWLAAAEKLLTPLVERYALRIDPAPAIPRGFLTHGCKSLRKNQGLVSELTFGDYYFVEALSRWLAIRATG